MPGRWFGEGTLGLSVDLFQCDCRESHPKGLGVDGRSHLGGVRRRMESEVLGVGAQLGLSVTEEKGHLCCSGSGWPCRPLHVPFLWAQRLFARSCSCFLSSPPT